MNIEEFERRYQQLFNDYQANKIEEATFIAEVDKLQFQDDWGRYWMIGAQTGAWHYYDGQTWHQENPREADNLPVVDEHGIYWQRGVKTGEWYYYQSETDEWVKPEDSNRQPSIYREPQPYQAQEQPYQAQEQQPYQAQEQQPYQAQEQQPYQVQEQAYQAQQAPAQQAPPSFDGELYQDADGRYWAVGAKTGQWYFYDANGWQPAQNYQAQQAPAQPQPAAMPSYQNIAQPQTTQGYLPQAIPAYPAQQAASNYVMPTQEAAPQPAQQAASNYVMPTQESAPQPAQQAASNYVMPTQEAAPQPAQPTELDRHLPKEDEIPPRQPSKTVDVSQIRQEQSATTNLETPAGAVTPSTSAPANGLPALPSKDQPPPSGGWYYFDGEKWLQYTPSDEDATPPTNKHDSVDKPAVEPIITAVDDVDSSIEVIDVEVIAVVEPEPDEPAATVGTALTPAPSRSIEPTSDWETPYSSSSGVPLHEEVKPRRATQPPKDEKVSPRRDSRPVNVSKTQSRKARKKSGGVVIPTGADPSSIPVRPNRQPSRPVRPQRQASRPVPRQGQQHRARESTIPIGAETGHRQATKPIPVQKQVARTEAMPQVVATPVSSQKESENLTFVEFVQALPITMWVTLIGAMMLLGACGAIILGGGVFQSTTADSNDGMAGIVAPQSETTPTLDTSIVPNNTPTIGPTKSLPTPTQTSTPSAAVQFCGENIALCIEHPGGWKTYQDESIMIFSPTEDGLDPENRSEVVMRLGQSTETTAVSEFLASVLSLFPLDAETLNEVPLSIAGHTWTSVQIQYNEAGQPIVATLAVTVKDDTSYYLAAVASAKEWNGLQPRFQDMIKSVYFGTADESSDNEEKTTPTKTATVESDDEIEVDDEATATADADETVVADETVETDETAEVEETDEADEDETTATSTATATKTATSTNTPTPKATATPTATPAPVIYEVKSGDTLSKIAQQFDIELDLLAEENGIDIDNSTLQIGEELVIPVADEVPVSSASDEEEEEDDEEVEEDTTAPPSVTDEDDTSDDTDEDDTSDDTDEDDISDDTDEESESGTATPTATSEPEEPAELSGRIVYPAFQNGPGSYDLWLYEIGTGDHRIIAGEASQPAFSRDGSLLAYRSWDIRSRGIIFRNFVSGEGGQATNFVEDGLPAWSPDGFSFIFSSRREGDRQPRLFRADSTRLGSDKAIPFEGVYSYVLSNGNIVARGCLPGSVDCGLYVMGSSGSNPKKIGSNKDTAPSASPDGTKIVFMSNGRGATSWEIWTMKIDGSGAKRLTNNGSNDGLPTWSPDGKSIAYASDQDGSWAIWVMNADGSNSKSLFTMKGSPNGKVLSDENNSFGWWEERISWAQ
ncbi:LysM peptidoglycan-binding domain-containing protein [Anaerolineales bacterium HSG24]|nr:LysM peptidoglycan-binding domain-containing protein [Anaerolineales bacterium HSG24]